MELYIIPEFTENVFSNDKNGWKYEKGTKKITLLDKKKFKYMPTK